MILQTHLCQFCVLNLCSVTCLQERRQFFQFSIFFVNIKIISRQLTLQTLAFYATILTEIKSVFNQYVSDDDDENNNINNNNLLI